MDMALAKKDLIAVKRIHTSGQQLIDNTYNLLDNLLHWALAQANQFFYQKENFHLKSILEQVLYNFKFNINSKKLAVHISISNALFIYADMNTIKIVLRNILDNAIKYSNQEGQINIYTEYSATKKNCKLIIEDTGSGIDKITLQNILKTNKILKRDQTKEVSTGLGLQLCKELLIKNNALLHIESKKNIGTKITISFSLTPLIPNDKNPNSTY